MHVRRALYHLVVTLASAALGAAALGAAGGDLAEPSECTLRAFTCGDFDPLAATPAEIERLRAIRIGQRVEGIVGGLAVEEAETPEPKGGMQ